MAAALRAEPPAAFAEPPPTDSLRDFADVLAGRWKADVQPAAAAIARFVASARDLTAARDGLAGLWPALPIDAFATRLGAATFQARLAGLLGVPVSDDELLDFAEPDGRVPMKPLTDREAVRYLEDKRVGERFSYDWRDVWQQEHVANFVVAKAMSRDLLTDMHGALSQALRQGWSRDRFVRELTPILQHKGWWGEVAVTDDKTGETRLVQAGSPRRLKLIYDVNLRMAHAAGRWERYGRIARPGDMLRYTAVMDSRTRPEHRAWNATLLPLEHPWWETHYPPCGWRCRCTTILVSEGKAKRQGLERTADEALTARGDDRTFDWANPRRGIVERVPEGIDPGFGYNVGRARLDAFKPPGPPGPLDLAPERLSPPRRAGARGRPAVSTAPTEGAGARPLLQPPRPLQAPSGAPQTPDAVWREAVKTLLQPSLSSAGAGPRVFIDKIGSRLVIDDDMFKEEGGAWKHGKPGHKLDPLIFARTISDPDEIWLETERRVEEGEVVERLRQRYVARWVLSDQRDVGVLAVFQLIEDAWYGVTIFAPNVDRSVQSQLGQLERRARIGTLVWRRDEGG